MADYIYLDHAAATPLDPAAGAAMQPFWTEQFFNPSAAYMPARAVREALETARAGAAHWLGARPGEIIFTAGGTEANNLALHGVMEQFPGSKAVVSAVEHESVLRPAHEFACVEAPVDADGRADVPALLALVDDATILVSVMYANNEVGTIQPIRDIAQGLHALRERRRVAGNSLPLYFHTDAAQAGAYLDLHAARLGVDLMTINGGKIYGPKATGVLYVSHRVRLKPQILGGGQERGQRSGTENVAGSIGLCAALDIAQKHRRAESERLRALQTLFFGLLEREIPDAAINGSRTHRLPNNVHVTLPGADNERLLIGLEQHGILAAAGSACSADSGEPSHVLRAMGLDDTAARASLRFTMGRSTTEATVRRTVATLATLSR